MKLAVIPARGGSVRIPRKNIRTFAGRPMLEWSIDTARASKLFDRIIVSTDDGEIADAARAAGAEAPFVRPAELADNHCGTLEVVSHAVRLAIGQGAPPDTVCCLYPTAAFTTAEDLEAAAGILSEGQWDYVFAAGRLDTRVQRAFTRGTDGAMRLLLPEFGLTRSQDLREVYVDAGQFYWGTASAWAEQRPIFGRRTTFIELPVARALDIDTEEDWSIAERQFIEWKQRPDD